MPPAEGYFRREPIREMPSVVQPGETIASTGLIKLTNQVQFPSTEFLVTDGRDLPELNEVSGIQLGALNPSALNIRSIARTVVLDQVAAADVDDPRVFPAHPGVEHHDFVVGRPTEIAARTDYLVDTARLAAVHSHEDSCAKSARLFQRLSWVCDSLTISRYFRDWFGAPNGGHFGHGSRRGPPKLLRHTGRLAEGLAGLPRFTSELAGFSSIHKRLR